MRSKVDLKPKFKKRKVIEVDSISDEDKSVWFIWIGLVFIAIATLPFIARSPNLIGFIADLCLTVFPVKFF